MRVLIAACAVLFAACAPLGIRDGTPRPAVLHPQVSRVVGEAYLQPRHNREKGPLKAPTLLEPGDWIETGADGKVEILLPGAVVRLYRHTRVQVPFAFEERTAVSRELTVEAGEALVDVIGSGFTVRTAALEVEVTKPGATLLVGARDGLHEAACYRGRAEARNVRVRGQTVIRMEEGHRLTLDDPATLALLQAAKLPEEWRRWERPTILFSGIVRAPAPPEPAAEVAPAPALEPASAPAAAEPAPQRPITEQPLSAQPGQGKPLP